MIKAIRIQGFQSHENSVLELGPGLNVITGPSGSGKTAILRAIKWVAFNEPAGEAYVNAKVGEAIAEIHLDNGAIITKHRRKGKTSYLIQQDPGDEGSLYEKAEVPEEVKRLLQVEKQTFGDFEAALNFSFQLDPPFLLSETASAGAKILGKLAGTESVDLAIKGVSKDTYGTRQDRTNAEKDIERLAASMLAYAHIDDAKEAVDIAEMLLTQVEVTDAQVDTLRTQRQAYEVATRQVNEAINKLDRLMVGPQLEEDLKDIEKAQQRYDLALDLYTTYNQLAERLANIDRSIANYEGVELAAEVMAEVDRAETRLELLRSLSNSHEGYTRQHKIAVETLEKVKDVEQAVVEIQETEKQLTSLIDLKELRLNYEYRLKEQNKAQERIESLAGINEAESTLKGTETNLERLASLLNLQRDLESNTRNMEKHENWTTLADRELQAAQLEIQAAWEAAGDICPLCEQPHDKGAC